MLLDILKQVRLQLVITTLYRKWYKWHLVFGILVYLSYVSASF